MEEKKIVVLKGSCIMDDGFTKWVLLIILLSISSAFFLAPLVKMIIDGKIDSQNGYIMLAVYLCIVGSLLIWLALYIYFDPKRNRETHSIMWEICHFSLFTGLHMILLPIWALISFDDIDIDPMLTIIIVGFFISSFSILKNYSVEREETKMCLLDP